MPAAPATDASPRLVLASASPRRSHLLSAAGVSFETVPANIPEQRQPGEAPREFALRLAREKALAVGLQQPRDDTRWVLGADTIVVLGDRILGKPRDLKHAESMLCELAARRHDVITAVALAPAGEPRVHDLAVTSHVHFRAATREEIRAYVAMGESLDKAGAYGLQGEGRRFVSRVEGSETNVIGLPMEATLELLHRVAGIGEST